MFCYIIRAGIRRHFVNDTTNSMVKKLLSAFQNSLYPKWNSKAF